MEVGYKVTLNSNMDCHDHTAGSIVRVTEVLHESDGSEPEYEGEVISPEDQKGNTVTFCDRCKENVLV